MDFIYQISEWTLFFLMMPLLLGAGEIGHRIGYPFRNLYDSPAQSTLGTIQAGVLGLMGLLLGFLFSMAVGRFEMRRTMIVEEANAVGTTGLRSEFLPAEKVTDFRLALRKYTELRIAMGKDITSDPAYRKAAEEVAVLQEHLWKTGVDMANQKPTSQPASLLVQSLNELFDAQGRTRAAYLNHVPETGILMVFLVATFAMGLIGYGSGLVGNRMFRSQFLFSFLVTMVLLLIMDMDRPWRGMIGISQAPMQEAAEALGQKVP